MTLRGYLRDFGVARTMLDLGDLVRAQLVRTSDDSVPGFVASYLGDAMYRRSGLATYVERLYGMKDTEVALEFAAQRLGEFRQYTLGGLCRRWLHRVRSPAQAPTLARHANGFDVVYDAVERELRRIGVQVEKSIEATALNRRAGLFSLETTRWQREYAHVISTVPVPVVMRLLDVTPEGDYESMCLHSLFFRGRLGPAGNIFYNFTPHGAWKRLIAFSRLYRTGDVDDHFTVEVTRRSADGTEALAEEFVAHAVSLGLVQEPRLVGSVVTPDAYPVFRRGQAAARRADGQRLLALGVRTAGRQGRFEYVSSDEAIRQGKAVVPNGPG